MQRIAPPPLAPARRGYHHGNLRDALVEAARALVAERGAAGFTLAEAAKRAGVTAAAPYRHFNDRNALLVELARRGFEAFGARLEQAWDDGRPSSAIALRRMGEAYLAFAKEEPGLYAAMFENAATSGTAALAAASGAALESLRRAACATLADYGAQDCEGHLLASQIWAIAHGVASLAQSGHFAAAEHGVDARAILDESVGAFIEKTARDHSLMKVR
jgi:AcrR family transcriptional regulator